MIDRETVIQRLKDPEYDFRVEIEKLCWTCGVPISMGFRGRDGIVRCLGCSSEHNATAGTAHRTAGWLGNAVSR